VGVSRTAQEEAAMSTLATTSKTHYRACNLCEAICGLEIAVVDGEVRSIKGDPADPFSRGHVCPKAVALLDIQNDPDRLRTPVRRVGDRWEPMAWGDAFDLVAARLADVIDAHGEDAIATYQGNPSVHNLGLMTHARSFLGLIKTRNRFTATSLDQLPHQLVTYWMYGHQLLVPIPDIDHTQYLLILGANPLASNGSMMTVPDVAKRLAEVRRRGGKVVTIDPRRSETAKASDEHHFIRPGSDAAFLLALLNVIVHERGVQPGRLEPLLDGFADVVVAVRSATPERAASATGIEAAVIRRLAHDFAAAERAVCYGRTGVSTQEHGALCQWLIQLINIATGNLDRVGGSLVTQPAIDLIAAPNSRPGSYGRWNSRVGGHPEALGELPTALLADEILTPGEGQVCALITLAGNPVLSAPNGRRLERALTQLEFMLSIDLYINETTCHADIILPTTAPLEHDHYDLIFHHLAVRNTARYNAAVLPKPDHALHDWEILGCLGETFARARGLAAKPTLPPEAILDAGLRFGPYHLSLDELRAAPHGTDFGPLARSFPERLATPNKRIVCAPQPLLSALRAEEPTLFATPALDQLLLIGRRDLRSNNSWMHNSLRLVRGKRRCDLLMHPADAGRLGVADGQRLRVRSRSGSIEVAVQHSSDVMPGVVSLPHGWGHDRIGVRMTTAREHPGVSANDVTDANLRDSISGAAAFNGVPVTVEAL
jgi:anaerobic selenocysteine-containing dehydrogenase